jgi:hypothetical protein
LVGDDEVLGGSGDGDDTPMVGPVMVRADQHQVLQFGGSAVLPVLDVVGVQSAGRPAPGHHTAAVAVLENAAQPTPDRTGRPSRADHPPVAFEPDLAGGITGQVATVVIG